MPPQKWQSLAQTLPPHRCHLRESHRREHNPVYSLSPGHLGHAQRSAGRIISDDGQLPPFASGRRINVPPSIGLPGFGELLPHEDCAGVRGDEDHEFAWSGGPSFLVALDIARPAMPVHHKPPRRRVENSTMPSPWFPPQGTASRNSSRSGLYLASSMRLPMRRRERAIPSLRGFGKAGASKTSVFERSPEGPVGQHCRTAQ